MHLIRFRWLVQLFHLTGWITIKQVLQIPLQSYLGRRINIELLIDYMSGAPGCTALSRDSVYSTVLYCLTELLRMPESLCGFAPG